MKKAEAKAKAKERLQVTSCRLKGCVSIGASGTFYFGKQHQLTSALADGRKLKDLNRKKLRLRGKEIRLKIARSLKATNTTRSRMYSI